MTTMAIHVDWKDYGLAPPIDGRLYAGTAASYARYRPGYPVQFINHILKQFVLGSCTTILDLGCGTGQLALDFAARGIPVIAVDPDPDMLAQGMRDEMIGGIRGVGWVRGNDRELADLGLVRPHLCTMGTSFHWMDRQAVLNTLAQLGCHGVALLGYQGASIWSERPDGWRAVVREVVVEFLGPERRAGSYSYAGYYVERHEQVLARSPFSQFERLELLVKEAWTVEQVVGLQLATPYASSDQLGTRTDEFVTVLTQRLKAFAKGECLTVPLSFEALIATR